MTLPFSLEDFLGVFVRYNLAIWPAQVVAYALGIMAVALVFTQQPFSSRAISGILSAFWLITGALYHLIFFRAINPAAVLFGALFIAQALMFVWVGVARGGLTFTLDRTPRSVIGGVIVLYAMVLYPLLGLAFGHTYPAMPVFGVAPCPVTVFTFGMLLWTSGRTRKSVLMIPLLWSVLGLSAATTLGMREDLGMIVAAVVAVVLLLPRRGAEGSVARVNGLLT